MQSSQAPDKQTLAALRSLRRKQAQPERCELCSMRLGEPHPHLLERASGRIACSCAACAILFSYRDEELKFVRIPDRPRALTDFQMSDSEWAALMLPIDMAFFLHRSTVGRTMAYYPSPAGCTESLLSLESWTDLVQNNPALEGMQPDVEALLVNRTHGRRDCYIAPVDHCYRLTGLIRVHWRGLSGGDAVWGEIDSFFEALAHA